MNIDTSLFNSMMPITDFLFKSYDTILSLRPSNSTACILFQDWNNGDTDPMSPRNKTVELSVPFLKLRETFCNSKEAPRIWKITFTL